MKFLILRSDRNKQGKPATRIVCEGADWSDLNLRERRPSEAVHLRDEQHQRCFACGATGGVWVENASSFVTHSARCSEYEE